MPLERDEFTEALNRLYHGIEGIHSRLDVLNGRTRTNEMDIATIRAKFMAYTSAAGAVITALTWAIGHFTK